MAQPTKKTQIFPLIFDTDVLIWYFRGNHHAHALLKTTEKEQRWITSLSYMELIQGCRSQEEQLNIQTFVAENFSRMIHPKTSISEKAIHLLQEYALSHGLRVVDALIASSALVFRAVLASGNERHFRFIPGLKFYPFKA